MLSSDGWLWVFRAGMGFLLLAALLFLLGFSTDHWHDDDDVHYGLWNSCDGARCSTMESDDVPAYHVATQAFQTMAVLFFGLSPIVHLCVYCCKKRKDTGWRSRILDIGYSTGIVLHVCSLLIFGLENPTPENFAWSYGMSCASAAIAFLGIIMIIISRSKALSKFTFRSVNRNKRKTAASETSTVDRSFDQNRSNPIHSEKVITSSTSDQSYSMRVPDTNTNVNINININTGPPSSQTTSSSQESSGGSSYDQNHPPNPNDKSNFPTIVPETHQRLHPKPSDSLVDYPVTQVRSAPRSSTAIYTSPTHKKIFGPADGRRTLESIENTTYSNSPSRHNRPLPPISGLSPSAPPYDETDIERDNPPPSYTDAIKGSRSFS